MHSRRRLAAVAGLMAVAALVGSGCGADTRTEVTVLAAASLREAFSEIAHDFEHDNPGTVLIFSFAASSALTQQAIAGAPADVIAPAGDEPMRQLVAAGLGGGDPALFARNQLVIAVPLGNPRRITSLRDLETASVAVCAPQVPCGKAAATVLDAAGVGLTPASLEPDVKATLTKVRLGEVDAALVYRTDIPASDHDVQAVEFPESAQALVAYHLIVLPGAPAPRAARRFVQAVLSPSGQSVLTRLGFAAP